MDVIVYEDNKAYTDYLKEVLNEFNLKHQGLLERGSIGRPTYFERMGDILRFVDSRRGRECLYILDIMTDKVHTGYKIGEYIKKANRENLIIYVTNFREEILSNMRHKMLSEGFIFKDSENFKEELEEGLLIAKSLLTGQYFIHNSYRETFKIKFEDIYYFEKLKETNFVLLVGKRGTITFKGSLRSIKPKLPDYFCYASKEYVVNARAIRRLDKFEKMIYFYVDRGDNKVECPFSRTRKQELLQWMSGECLV